MQVTKQTPALLPPEAKGGTPIESQGAAFRAQQRPSKRPTPSRRLRPICNLAQDEASVPRDACLSGAVDLRPVLAVNGKVKRHNTL